MLFQGVVGLVRAGLETGYGGTASGCGGLREPARGWSELAAERLPVTPDMTRCGYPIDAEQYH
jgi:hypothetical protein